MPGGFELILHHVFKVFEPFSAMLRVEKSQVRYEEVSDVGFRAFARCRGIDCDETTLATPGGPLGPALATLGTAASAGPLGAAVGPAVVGMLAHWALARLQSM